MCFVRSLNCGHLVIMWFCVSSSVVHHLVFTIRRLIANIPVHSVLVSSFIQVGVFSRFSGDLCDIRSLSFDLLLACVSMLSKLALLPRPRSVCLSVCLSVCVCVCVCVSVCLCVCVSGRYFGILFLGY